MTSKADDHRAYFKAAAVAKLQVKLGDHSGVTLADDAVAINTSVNAKERPFGITFTAIARKAKLSRSSAKVTSSFTAIAKRISKAN
jgi:hypothetical protein